VAVTRSASPGGRRQSLRTYLVLLGLAIVGVWLVFVFARTLGDLNEASRREAVVRAEAASLQERLEQTQRELELVQTDAFLRLQARGYGMGAPGEVVFTLETGQPPPEIMPLGGTPSPSAPITPLEAWLALLFGD
jgi:cell division protein FtsB